MINAQTAETIARDVLEKKGILPLEILAVRKIPGSLRSAHIPEKPSDYWILTFKRSTTLVDSAPAENSEEFEIVSAVAESEDSVCVSVEMDGTAEVI